MTNVELRKSLLKKISSINDSTFLNALNVIIDNSQISEPGFRLNSSQKKSIQISREEIRNGKFISHEDVIKKQAKWLKK